MFPFEFNEYLDKYPHIFVSDFQNFTSASSSSSPLSSNGFFNSNEFHHVEIHQPKYHQSEVINHVSKAESHDLKKRDDQDQSLKFTLRKNEDDQSEIKWMSSKMRKVKGSNHGHIIKFNDQNKKQASSSLIYHDHTPIRVCADCNTTKTPLWRSGPNGPKSLCNACGIRQRKARRAMAAAVESGKKVMPEPEMASPMIKVRNKVFKKRCRTPTEVVVMTESSSNNNNNNNAPQKKKNNLEEFFYNFSKNLSLQRVFPQEETDAAILLMALSCS